MESRQEWCLPVPWATNDTCTEHCKDIRGTHHICHLPCSPGSVSQCLACWHSVPPESVGAPHLTGCACLAAPVLPPLLPVAHQDSLSGHCQTRVPHGTALCDFEKFQASTTQAATYPALMTIRVGRPLQSYLLDGEATNLLACLFFCQLQLPLAQVGRDTAKAAMLGDWLWGPIDSHGTLWPIRTAPCCLTRLAAAAQTSSTAPVAASTGEASAQCKSKQHALHATND